ncbi:MAG: SAM-dependent methyltransferase [Pseudonocardia sp.]
MTEDPATGARLSNPIDTSVPHSARIWNYWLGGKDNYQVDREAGDSFAELNPAIFTLARQSRQFLIRSVHHLVTEAGIRQFLDIGTGLPVMDNTHQVAQRAAPECRIVYVDNDPMVLAHARALLVNTTPDGVTSYVDADFHNPDQIVADARNLLNFDKPIGVMFMGVLGHVADYGESHAIVSRVMAATAPGSYLTLWDDTATDEAVVAATDEYAETGAVPYIPRTMDQIGRYFDGMDLVDPGVVSISMWRPNSAEVGAPDPVTGHGAVARKPSAR